MTRDECNTVAGLCEAFPEFTRGSDRLFALLKAARSLHSLAEAECNYTLSKWQETRKQNLQVRVREILETVGYTGQVRFNGDPRGAAVKIDLPTKRSNNWGGDFGI